MKLKTALFGYSKRQVNELFDQMENALETATKNVNYLSERCEQVERQLERVKPQPKTAEPRIDRTVTVSIQKSLEEEQER